MVAGQYKTKGEDDFKSTKVLDRYKKEKREKTVDRPEGNWAVIASSNETGEQPAHVVEAKLVEGDFAVNPKMVPFSTDPSKLLNGMTDIQLSPQQFYFVVGPEQFIWISAGNGSGKCISPRDEVQLIDGSRIEARYVQKGMFLCGFNRQSRKVLSTTSGRDEMYRIIGLRPQSNQEHPDWPVTATIHEDGATVAYQDSYTLFTCNSVHILTLYDSQTKHIIDIALNEFLLKPKDEQTKFLAVQQSFIEGECRTSLLNFRVEHIGTGDYCGWELDGDGRFLLANGTVTHNTKAGAIFVYMQIICNPNTLGLIAANSYAQLNQSTLKPLFEFLDEMGMPYVINRIPPAEWGLPRIFSDYESIMVFPTGAHILLRSLDRPANLEGLCFGKDTPLMAYDGSTILVQDLQIGDQLMGPEGLPRTVTKTSEGYGQLFQVTPAFFPEQFSKSPGLLARAHIERESEDVPDSISLDRARQSEGPDKTEGGRIKSGVGFICNAEHILVIYHVPTKTTVNMSLADYTSRADKHHYYYLYADGTISPFALIVAFLG